MQPEQPKPRKSAFFLQHLIKGVLFLVLIIGLYVIARRYFGFDLKEWMGPLYENPRAVFFIFMVSEVVFGIIPPEFFMIWSLRHGDVQIFISNVFILTFISYSAGIVGYWFGAYLNTTKAFNFFKKRVFGKFEEHFNEYGGFLVIVAAMTPIPFAGICMLVGSVRYPFARFLVFALSRCVRFCMYAYVIWHANLP